MSQIGNITPASSKKWPLLFIYLIKQKRLYPLCLCIHRQAWDSWTGPQYSEGLQQRTMRGQPDFAAHLDHKLTASPPVWGLIEIHVWWGYRVVFFYWSALKMTKCQTLRKFWHLELFRWDLLCNLTLRTFRGGPVKKHPLYQKFYHYVANIT